jgi:hypothetical protein
MLTAENKNNVKENLNHLFYFNGSCYYLSPSNKYEIFDNAKKICLDIGTNNFSNLYEFKNKLEYEYLINKTMTVYNATQFNQTRKLRASYYFGLETKLDSNDGW